MQFEDNSRSGTNGAHPSFTWDPALRAKPPFVRDRADFEAAMRNPRYPRASAWCPAWMFHNSLGPICLWSAEALAQRLPLQPGMRVLDLGCGTAATSIFLAHEFAVEVWAADLWVDPEDNRRRIEEAGLANRVHPQRAEAYRLPYDSGFFDAIVSIDAYHYFGTEIRYLSYLSQFVRTGGSIGIVVPANAIDPDAPDAERLPPSLASRLGADWFTFRNPGWWQRHWSRTSTVDVETCEWIEGAEDDWQRWIAADRAAYGVHPDVEFHADMLASAAGRSLGFCVAVARRNDHPGISLGAGEFESRIA